MSTQETETVPMPVAPGELWMLWKIGRVDNDDFTPEWCKALDDPRGGENHLVCLSEADAIAAAQHQLNSWGLVCRPVRVK